MKKALSISLILLGGLLSCSETKTKSPKEGQARILAVYTKSDGSKVVDVMLRQIGKTITTDEKTGLDKIALDTLWGYPVFVLAKDSLGRKRKDSSTVFIQIRKDSVNWKVENIPLDVLLKK